MNIRDKASTATVEIIGRHGVVWDFKHSGFIHIVPDTIDVLAHKVLVKASPPGTGSWHGEIRKFTWTWPNTSNEILACGIFHPKTAIFCLLIDKIGTVQLNPRVYHPHALEMQLVQIIIDSFWIGEFRLVKGKYPITVHIINVHPDYITGYLSRSKLHCNFMNFGIGFIGPTALLISKTPKRRKFHLTNQICKRQQ